jgi:monoterpene epsilon-lactone hydrolase
VPSQEFEALMRALPPAQPSHLDPPDVVRKKMHSIHPTSCHPSTILEETKLDGLEATWIATPESAASDRILMHVHGGAFVSTIVQHYLDYCQHISEHTGARVVCFQYRWAPDHPYPAALDDTITAYRALLASGLDASRIGFIGDSCGGGIALAATCRLRDAGEPLPACLVGLTPWLDAEQTGKSAVEPRGVDPFVETKWIRERFKNYAGPAGDLRDPLLSPIHSQLAGLPPIYLAVGGIDTTADDSIRLAERGREQGAQVIVDVAGEMIHGYTGLCGQFPEATEGMARVGDFVKRCIPST